MCVRYGRKMQAASERVWSCCSLVWLALSIAKPLPRSLGKSEHDISTICISYSTTLSSLSPSLFPSHLPPFSLFLLFPPHLYTAMTSAQLQRTWKGRGDKSSLCVKAREELCERVKRRARKWVRCSADAMGTRGMSWGEGEIMSKGWVCWNVRGERRRRALRNELATQHPPFAVIEGPC